MAAIIPNRKNGKIVSYKFKACLGRTKDGKQIFKCCTWKVPDGLAPSKQERAVTKAAEKWEKEIKAEYEKDLHDPERIKQREIAKQRTEFSSFVIDTWFPLCISNGEHKHTTVEFYWHTIKRLTERFEGAYIQNITALDIQRFLVYLRTECKTKNGKPISDKTVRHCYCILALVFEFAVKQELIAKNPMDKVDCPKLTKKKVTAFNQEQAKQFFSELNKCPIDFRCMLYLLITTGLRRGELLGLQWRDVDLNACTLDI